MTFLLRLGSDRGEYRPAVAFELGGADALHPPQLGERRRTHLGNLAES